MKSGFRFLKFIYFSTIKEKTICYRFSIKMLIPILRIIVHFISNAETQVEVYNWLGTAPVPPGGCRYWYCTGIIPGGKRLGTGIRPKCHSAGSCLSVPSRY